ncbi:MAG: hypothetical protein AB1420_14225 [Bacillota bacterium]
MHVSIPGGLASGIIYARAANLPLWKTADSLIPALILGQANCHIGNSVLWCTGLKYEATKSIQAMSTINLYAL